MVALLMDPGDVVVGVFFVGPSHILPGQACRRQGASAMLRWAAAGSASRASRAQCKQVYARNLCSRRAATRRGSQRVQPAFEQAPGGQLRYSRLEQGTLHGEQGGTGQATWRAARMQDYRTGKQLRRRAPAHSQHSAWLLTTSSRGRCCGARACRQSRRPAACCSPPHAAPVCGRRPQVRR